MMCQGRGGDSPALSCLWVAGTLVPRRVEFASDPEGDNTTPGPGGYSGLRVAPLLLVRGDLFRRGLGFLLMRADLELGCVLHDLVVQGDIVGEDIRHRFFLEDRLPWASGLARSAVNTFIGVNVELVRERTGVGARISVDAVYGTDGYAIRVDTIPAKASDDPSHSVPIANGGLISRRTECRRRNPFLV